MTTIIFGLLVFSVLVIIHEWGHFAVARWVGVRVERFSVGFGPVIFSKTWRGVQYVISALPLGGYVKMSGDDPRDRDALQPDDFFAVSWWRRVLIALAGPGANFLLAIVLGIVLAWVGITSPDAPNEIGSVDAGSVAAEVGFQDGDVVIAVDDQPVTARSGFVLGIVERENPGDASVTVLRDQSEVTLTVPESAFTDLFTGLRFPFPPIIGDVAIGTPAYSAGLKVGDRVTSINDKAIESWTDMTELIRSNPDQEIQLEISREDKNFIVPVVPMGVENNGEVTGRLGIGATSEQTFTRRFGFGEGVVVGTRAALMAVGMTFQSIGSLVTGGASLSQVSGPVAIIQASGAAAKAGVDALLNFALYISVALMVFNLLPIPILDGGMVVLSTLEGLRRRPVGERGLAVYQGIGMAVIGTLLIFVLINDPHRIWKRHTAMDRATEVQPVTESP